MKIHFIVRRHRLSKINGGWHNFQEGLNQYQELRFRTYIRIQRECVWLKSMLVIPCAALFQVKASDHLQSMKLSAMNLAYLYAKKVHQQNPSAKR